jgi:4-hydroxy-tetrahydrodipicolinate reductase
VVYAPHEADFDDVCRLLEAGINLSTSRMEFNYRGRMAPELLARIEAACARGGSSLYATGSTPGSSPRSCRSLSRRSSGGSI